MNLTKFSNKFAAKYDIPKYYAKNFIQQVFKCLGEEIYANGEKVTINGFGTFYQHTLPERRVRLPKSGELYNVPSKTIVKFKPTEAEITVEEEEE